MNGFGRANRSTRRKPAPTPLCPQQIPLAKPLREPGPATNRFSYGAALKKYYYRDDFKAHNIDKENIRRHMGNMKYSYKYSV
jgi:hypothetical protein